MKITTTILLACLCITLVNSIPLKSGFQSQALDRLMVDETVNDSAMRSKRTIGILRQLFPDLSKMIDDKVNAIVGEVVKIFGPVIFNSILGNRNGGAGGSKTTGSSVEAKNSFDNDDTSSFIDDDDWFNAPAKSNDGSAKISFDLPTVKSAEQASLTTATSIMVTEPSFTKAKATIEENITTTRSNEEETTTQTDDSATNSDMNPEGSETNQIVNEADNQAESQNNEVRVQFADEVSSQSSDTNEGELAPLEDLENDDENRNKRFLNFGFGASGGNGNGGGSGGGSGNFLFDIIRQAADSAARAAGTVYRVVAGTQSLGLGLSASRDIGPAPMMPAAAGDGSMPAAAMPPQAPPNGQMMPMPGMPANGTAMNPSLVAGSGSSSSDPAAGAPTPGPQTEAVPGPVTRLFVIANRGISNLIQDLILRLAATSERIVNFKARLITSII